MESNKNYYAVIPATVRYDKNLTTMAKVLYGEITALCNEKGYCWASNSYFAELYGVKNRTVINWINSLINGGYIKTSIQYEEGTKIVKQRLIYLSNVKIDLEEIQCAVPSENKFTTPVKNNSQPSENSFTTPSEKSFTENNTVINNTVNNKKENIKRKVFDYSDNEQLRQVIFKFIDFRKNIKNPMSEYAITLLLNRLDRLTESEETKIEILNQSILNGWKSVYPLKEEVNNNAGNIRDDKQSEDNNEWNGTVL